MRKKLLLSCLSAIALAALGIGANADIFKPYERYEVPVETLDVIEEVKEDSVKADETAVEAVDKEIVADENQKTKAQAFSSEGKRKKSRMLIIPLCMKKKVIQSMSHQRKYQLISLPAMNLQLQSQIQHKHRISSL